MLGTRSGRCGAAVLAPLLLVAGWLPPVCAQAPPANGSTVTGEVVRIVGPRTSLEIVERFSRVLEFPAGLVRVDGFDDTVLSITPLGMLPGENVSRQLRVQALEQGVTTIVVTDAAGQIFNVEVFVSGDARHLQAVLRQKFPNTAVQVSKLRNTILLRGWVAEPHQISEIMDIARNFGAEVLNQMKVAGPQDVQLRVKILEAQRSAIRRFGINFVASGRNATVISTPGPISPLSTLTLPFGGPPVPTLADSQLGNASLALGVATDNFVFEGLIQALKEEGLLKISAEPVLVTRSGEGARLINGGEFPIPVPQSLGTVTIEWREFGVALESLPIVLGPTTLKQQIKAEVSERDFSTAVTLGGTTVPGLTKRTVETQTVMEFGQTLVIGGLIATRYTAETDKIPWLGELPGVGAAFRRVRYDTAETELVVLITPEYVSAISPEQVLPGGPGKFTTVPTDRELYGSGFIEVPNYGDQCPLPGYPAGSPGMWPGPMGPAPLAPEGVPPAPGAVPPGPAPTAEPGLILPPGAAPNAPPPAPSVTKSSAAPRSGTTASALASSSRPLPTTPSAPQRTGARSARDGVNTATYRFDEQPGSLIEPASARQPTSAPK